VSVGAHGRGVDADIDVVVGFGEGPDALAAAGQPPPGQGGSFNDTGVFDGAAGLFAERMVVISGTGVFSQATGHLFFAGTGTTSFSADVTGEICLHTN
jgi:hypothetical protein